MVRFPDTIPSIQISDNFTLRTLTLDKQDIKCYWECYNDPSVVPFLPEDCVPKTIQNAEEDIVYLNNCFQGKKTIFWAIAELSTNNIIGTINLHTISHYHSKAEIAYEVIKEYRGIGIAFSACKAVLNFGFNNVGLNRIEATTLTNNVPSTCLLQKLGFNLEGVLSEYKLYREEFVDIAMFGLPFCQYNLLQSKKARGHLYNSKSTINDIRKKKLEIVQNNITKTYKTRGVAKVSSNSKNVKYVNFASFKNYKGTANV
ncbi:MAG: GNAT family N-acetyltransferase [Alphaproteobacteria bacterium]|nr:GNAT family N-acetyltransferase [Rickettsiales bacterium]